VCRCALHAWVCVPGGVRLHQLATGTSRGRGSRNTRQKVVQGCAHEQEWLTDVLRPRRTRWSRSGRVRPSTPATASGYAIRIQETFPVECAAAVSCRSQGKKRCPPAPSRSRGIACAPRGPTRRPDAAAPKTKRHCPPPRRQRCSATPALSSSGMARSQIRAEPKGGVSNSVSSAGTSSSGSSAGVSSSGCSSSAWREGRAHGAGVRTRPGLRRREGDPAPPRRGHHTHLHRHGCVASLGEIRPPACSIRSRPVPSSTRPPVLE
jgi:hypothetical protein